CRCASGFLTCHLALPGGYRGGYGDALAGQQDGGIVGRDGCHQFASEAVAGAGWLLGISDTADFVWLCVRRPLWVSAWVAVGAGIGALYGRCRAMDAVPDAGGRVGWAGLRSLATETYFNHRARQGREVDTCGLG